MRSAAHVQLVISHAGFKAGRPAGGAGKSGPKPPRIVWAKTATGWVAA